MSAENLECYLNDHLAGAAGALQLLEDLSQRELEGIDPAFFRSLHEEVYADHELLKRLMAQADLDSSEALMTMGKFTGAMARLKLQWEGFEPGELGLFEALEMLALGIQGKRLLWGALGGIAPTIPGWTGIDFTALAESAKSQRNQVEIKRLAVSREALAKE